MFEGAIFVVIGLNGVGKFMLFNFFLFLVLGVGVFFGWLVSVVVFVLLCCSGVDELRLFIVIIGVLVFIENVQFWFFGLIFY